MQKSARTRVIIRISIAIVVTSAMAASGLAVASSMAGGKGRKSTAGSVAPGSTAAAAAPDIEEVAISLAANKSNMPTRDGDLNDVSRYCDPNNMRVLWEPPTGTYLHGAYIEPLGPEPGPDTASVNGVVICDGSNYSYMGFEAIKDADGWQLLPVPDIGSGDEEDTSTPEAPGDKVVPTLVPRTTLPKATGSSSKVTKIPKAAAALTAGIETYSGYDSQDTCDPTAKPGVLAFRNLLLTTYPITRSLGITRNCSIGGKSEHKEGRAFDWGVNINRPAERATAQRVIDWLFATDGFGNPHAMARRLGIMYIVWNHKIWGAYRSGEGWRSYNGANPHTDHVHFSFAWPGATGVTSFWTGVPATMPGGNAGGGSGHGRGQLTNFRSGGSKNPGNGTWTYKSGSGRHHRDGYWTYDKQAGWTWHAGARPSPKPTPSATKPSSGSGDWTWSPTPKPTATGSGGRRHRGDWYHDGYHHSTPTPSASPTQTQTATASPDPSATASPTVTPSPTASG